jgi:hypothetical protein
VPPVKFATCPLAALALAALIVLPAPLLAGSFAEKAEPELRSLGSLAGYVVATIGPCGGNDAEIEFFTGQVKKMVISIGGDEADFAIVLEAIAKGRAEAKPKGHDCTDEGGMALAAKLGQLRDAVRDAGE